MQTLNTFLRRHPVAAYFGVVLLVSYGSFLVVVGPKLLHGGREQASDAEYILFPILDWGVLLAALVFTGILDGRTGVRQLFARMGRWRVQVRWYVVALLLPPVLVLAVLLILRTAVSPIFAPKLFVLGVVFGLPGVLEEIGWTGYVLPKLQMRHSALAAAVVLGVVWGLWHAPVVDYLGAAAPHGAYWLPFFVSFIALVAAMRVLIVWVYANTGSLLLAQLMHVSMTASLVVFAPVQVSPAQETLWYGAYAAVLWMIVVLVAARYGKHLTRHSVPAQTVHVTA